jgi:hypothetical protein
MKTMRTINPEGVEYCCVGAIEFDFYETLIGKPTIILRGKRPFK